MGLSEAAERLCKDHPYHDQRLGVCPSCLRDKLSQLYVAVSYRDLMVVGPSSSANLSPVHQRNGSDLMGSMSFRISLGLKKSKSMAFVPASTGNNSNKKKKGFWANILHPRKHRKEFHLDTES